MPRLCYPNAPYGCGHHDEHVRAAKLGWLRRRGLDSAYARNQKSAERLSAMYGEPVTDVHAHKTHPGEMRFRMGGKWYRMPKAEFAEMDKLAGQIQRENARAQKQLERQNVREHASAEKRAAREAVQEAQYRDALIRLGEDEQLRLARDVWRDLSKRGISPDNRSVRYYRHLNRSLPALYGEWSELPKALRRRRGGIQFDQVPHFLAEAGAISQPEAEALSDNMTDIVGYLNTIGDARRNVREARRKRKDELDDLRQAVRALSGRRRTAAA